MDADPRLLAALATAAGRVPPERIDRVWLFPLRTHGDRASGLAVLSAHPLDAPPDEARLLVYTVGFESIVEGGKRVTRETIAEQALVPPDRIEAVLGGVLRRLGEEGEIHETYPVDGDPARWAALLDPLRGSP